MAFPKTGRVLIIDDKIHEAHEVMQGLSKMGIAYSYISGNYDDLPSEKDLPSIRLLILDLNLDWEAVAKTDSDEKTFKSKMHALLKRVIKEHSKYILAVWGKKEDVYFGWVKDLFNDSLTSRKPFRTFSLKKSDYFDLEGKRINEDKSIIQDIKEHIQKQLNDTPTYRLLNDWENCIHKATNETVNSFNELIVNPEKYEQEANNIVYRLSRAYLGNQFTKVSRPERKMEAALLTLNDLFNDSLEKIILSPDSLSTVSELEYGPTPEGFEGKVNRKLLISEDVSDKQYTGIIFSSESQNFKTIFSDSLNREEIRKIRKYKFDNPDRLRGDARKKAERKDFDKFCKKFRDEERKDCYPINLHITPLCDFAQNKWKVARMIEGMIAPEDLKPFIHKTTEFLYTSDFSFLHNEKNHILVLDFRYFHSVEINDLENFEPLFRMRHPWLSDIQSKILRHINRPGILYL